MDADDPRHGTPRGRAVHLRHGEMPCVPCRLAYNEYMRNRRDDPAILEADRARNAAFGRAKTRIAQLYPDDFATIYAEELEKVGLDSREAKA